MAVNHQIEGATSTNVVEVDASSNLKTTLPTVDSTVGAFAIYSKTDGSGVGFRKPYTSEDGRFQLALASRAFDYDFNPTAQDTGKWKYAFTTMTMTQSGGFLNCNANNTITAATGASLQSFAHFPMLVNGSLAYGATIAFTGKFAPGQIFEWGAFLATTTTAPAEGCFMQFTAAGLVGVMIFNGTRFETKVLLPFSSITANQNYQFSIVLERAQVEFWVEDTLLQAIQVPDGWAGPHVQVAMPMTFQIRNTTVFVDNSVSQVKVAACYANYDSMRLEQDSSIVAAYHGQMGSQGGAGGTQGSTASYTNSQAPGTGSALANATALVTGLGGQCAFLPTLTINTDGILCSYQVPAGGVTQRPRALILTGIRVQGVVTTVLAGGPVQLAYSLAYGHTAVDMATAETGSFVTGTTNAPRRVPIGIERYALNAAVGTLGSGGLVLMFASPIVVQPGHYIAVCARNDDTVTTTGVITALVTFDAYWR